MRKMKLFMGFYLVMQALTCLMLMILFLFRGKKNSAGVFLTAGTISGLCGAITIYRQIRSRLEDNRLSAIIDELLSSEEDDEEEAYEEIPLDEMASESDFAEGEQA